MNSDLRREGKGKEKDVLLSDLRAVIFRSSSSIDGVCDNLLIVLKVFFLHSTGKWLF